jgi:putative addiction module killer protein
MEITPMQVLEHDEFSMWLAMQTDGKLIAIFTKRLDRLAAGNFGDHESVGDGVSELRIHYGQGWRIYYTIRGRSIVILLCGGSKSSQKKDIEKAKELNKEV